MKKLLLTLLLSLGLTSISSAGYLDDWTDDQLCGWMDNPSPPEYIVAEVNDDKRKNGLGGFGAAPNSEVCVDDIVVLKLKKSLLKN